MQNADTDAALPATAYHIMKKYILHLISDAGSDSHLITAYFVHGAGKKN